MGIIRDMTWEKPNIKHQKITKYGYIVEYPENLEMESKSDIGVFTYIQAKFGVKIHKNVQIGPYCAILSHSTIGDKKGKVVIKEGAQIGAHTTIMPNTTIGKNSIVQAYSYIDKDVPDGKIVKKIK